MVQEFASFLCYAYESHPQVGSQEVPAVVRVGVKDVAVLSSFLPKDCSGAGYCRTIPAWGPVLVEEQKVSCQTACRNWVSSSTGILTPSQRESLFQIDPSPPNQFLELEPPHSLKTGPQLLRAKFPNVSHHDSERCPLPVFQIWVPHPTPFT